MKPKDAYVQKKTVDITERLIEFGELNILNVKEQRVTLINLPNDGKGVSRRDNWG